MRQRCFYSKHIEFHRYGGRGITMCEQWNSFEQFLTDMGPCPKGLTLERIDLDGPYSPANCKWATIAEQMNNTSKNIRVEYNSRIYTLKELSEVLGLNYYSLHAYYRRRNLPLADAIAKSARSRRD